MNTVCTRLLPIPMPDPAEGFFSGNRLKILLEKEIAYNVLFTKYQHHATRLVHDLTSDGAPHTIVVLGGDGTLNEVIDGIRYLDKVTLDISAWFRK